MTRKEKLLNFIKDNKETPFLYNEIVAMLGVEDKDLFGNCEFLLVSSVESNPFDERMPKISNESQLGSALMKAKVGDVIQIANDNVSYSIKIISIE